MWATVNHDLDQIKNREILITNQYPLQPLKSIPRLCDILPAPNVIGPVENAKMIGRCHTSSKSDGHTLECEDTDNWSAGTQERARSPWEANY